MSQLAALLGGLLVAFAATLLVAPDVLSGLLVGALLVVAGAFVVLGAARIRRVIDRTSASGAPVARPPCWGQHSGSTPETLHVPEPTGVRKNVATER